MNWRKFGSAILADQKSQFPFLFMNWRPNFESMDDLGKVTSLLKIRWRIHIGRDDHILNLA